MGVNIVVDSREVSSGVLEVLVDHFDIDVAVQHLAVGDYLIDNSLLIERKTLPDLVSAIKEGRLFSQARRLAESGYQSLIILEGTGKDLARSSMRREAIQGALISVTLIFGVPLLRSKDLAESVRLMIYAAGQSSAIVNGALPRHGRRVKGRRGLQLYILQGLPNVGPQRARWLLKRFGSVEAVVTASVEDLEAVEGIGSGIAEKIRWAVKEPSLSYRPRFTRQDKDPGGNGIHR